MNPDGPMLQEKESKSKKWDELNLKETAFTLITGKGMNAHSETCM